MMQSNHTISFRVTDDEKHPIQSVLRGIASSDRFFLQLSSLTSLKRTRAGGSAYFESTGTVA